MLFRSAPAWRQNCAEMPPRHDEMPGRRHPRKNVGPRPLFGKTQGSLLMGVTVFPTGRPRFCSAPGRQWPCGRSASPFSYHGVRTPVGRPPMKSSGRQGTAPSFPARLHWKSQCRIPRDRRSSDADGTGKPGHARQHTVRKSASAARGSTEPGRHAVRGTSRLLPLKVSPP